MRSLCDSLCSSSLLSSGMRCASARATPLVALLDAHCLLVLQQRLQLAALPARLATGGRLRGALCRLILLCLCCCCLGLAARQCPSQCRCIGRCPLRVASLLLPASLPREAWRFGGLRGKQAGCGCFILVIVAVGRIGLVGVGLVAVVAQGWAGLAAGWRRVAWLHIVGSGQDCSGPPCGGLYLLHHRRALLCGVVGDTW